VPADFLKPKDSNFKTLSNFILLTGFLLCVISGVTWYVNVQPKYQEEAFLHIDASKNTAFHINSQLNQLYKNNTQPINISFQNNCESNIGSIQFNVQEYGEIQKKVTNLKTELEKIGYHTSNENLFISNQKLLDYLQSVKNNAFYTQSGLEERFFRQSVAVEILDKVTKICLENNVEKKQNLITNLEQELKQDGNYKNLNPEWKIKVLSWLKLIQKDLDLPPTPESLQQYQDLFLFSQTSDTENKIKVQQNNSNYELENLQNWQKNLQESTFKNTKPVFIETLNES